MYNELYHHGILGQKWGVRRYQNENGSLTDAGRKHYYGGESSRKAGSIHKKLDKENASWDKYENKLMSGRAKHRSKLEDRYNKKIAKIKKDEDSFNPIKNGLKDQFGRDILTKEDVAKSQKVFTDKRLKLESKRDNYLKDFDEGTKIMQKSIDSGRKYSTDYLKMKKDSVYDPSIKNSKEYKNAEKMFKSQKFKESWYGKDLSVIMRAGDIANGKSSGFASGDKDMLNPKHNQVMNNLGKTPTLSQERERQKRSNF